MKICSNSNHQKYCCMELIKNNLSSKGIALSNNWYVQCFDYIKCHQNVKDNNNLQDLIFKMFINADIYETMDESYLLPIGIKVT